MQCEVIKFNFRIPLFYLSLQVLLWESFKHNLGKLSENPPTTRCAMKLWNGIQFFLRALRSIYSYFGIVWNQNTMNKLNPYSNRSISWHFVFWLQFSVKSREQVEGSDVNYQNVKLTFFRVQRCSPAQNSVLKNLKLTWCIFQRKITTWVNRNIKLWAKTGLNFLLPWQRWYWYRAYLRIIKTSRTVRASMNREATAQFETN